MIRCRCDADADADADADTKQSALTNVQKKGIPVTGNGPLEGLHEHR